MTFTTVSLEEPISIEDSGCEKLISYDKCLKINDNTNTGSFNEDSAMNVMTCEEIETVFQNNNEDSLNLNSTMNNNSTNSKFMNFSFEALTNAGSFIEDSSSEKAETVLNNNNQEQYNISIGSSSKEVGRSRNKFNKLNR